MDGDFGTYFHCYLLLRTTTLQRCCHFALRNRGTAPTKSTLRGNDLRPSNENYGLVNDV
ncbi:MAG: hypothetical protein QOH48_1125 [Actinomycetota bacterium]|nr:hypothetical protein [Actinomycetota bacterium]